jgi:hypothetical protein
LLHKYVKPEGAFKITDPPAQNVVGPPAVITGIAGKGFTVTVVATEVAEHPFAFVTVTV